MFKKLIAGMVVVLVGTLLLTACGRKGALEPPPSHEMETEKGATQEKPQEDKPFILDPLI